MKQKISLKLSPSKIGQYYDKRCDKNLVSVSLGVVIDFYKRFVKKNRKAIEDYPNYNLIGIMWP